MKKLLIKILCFLTPIFGFLLFRSEYEKTCFIKSRYIIKDKKIKKDTTIVFLSDIHNKNYGKNCIYLTRELDTEYFDYLILGGDTISYKEEKSLSYLNMLLKNLHEKYKNKLIFTNGNHEIKYNKKHDDIIKYIVDKNNVTYLSNSFIESDEIRIYGLDLDLKYYKRFKTINLEKDYIKRNLGELDTDKFNILLPHNPEFFDEYIKGGFDLTLVGHNHGGAIRPYPHKGIITPNGRILSDNVVGMKEQNKKRMIISAGLGGHTINIRINNIPQIVIIKLVSEK